MWPPPVPFDVVYAGAVLRHFGTQALEDEVGATWKDAFDPGGCVSAACAEYKAARDDRVAAKRARSQARYDDAPDTFDVLMTLPYIMVPREELKAMLRGAKEAAEAAEQRRVQEKIDTWRKQVKS